MYCTTDDLRTAHPDIRLVETTDDENPNELGTFGTAIADATIVLACGIIDGYLASRYVLPLPIVPALLRKVAVDLSLHGLYERIGAAGEGSDMALRRKGALDMLKAIAKGDIALGLPKSEAALVQSESVSLVVSSNRPEFSDRSMDSIGGDAFRRFA